MRTQTKPPIAVVTGAGGGIGRAVVEALLKRGMCVVATDVESAAESLRAAMLHPSLIVRDMDVTQPAEVAHVAEFVEKELGGAAVLVCAAGVFSRHSVIRLDEVRMRQILAVNLEGPLRCMAGFGAGMAARGHGRIIHVASVAGLSGAALASAYSAAKAGVIAAAKSAARELAPRGVQVNVVAPGFCDTPMLAPERAAVMRFTVPHIPARRLGEPAEVAEAVAFLATTCPAYMTGAVLTIDGGLHVG